MPANSDSKKRVREGNERMWAAWHKGREVLSDLGEQAEYGAMSQRADGNTSRAEQMRKYRAIAQRISESELNTICELCVENQRAWGPTFLVALSRLTRARDRRQIAKKGIRGRWGLAEHQRRIRRELGPSEAVRNPGRKREFDLTSEVEILEQIDAMCVSWLRLAQQLSAETDTGIDVLQKKLRDKFQVTASDIEALKRSVQKRLNSL